ncbi:hypothetical protein IQ259_10000 [Fortiea sp. LEGE XX443]|uniref:hypothetical protein n=1 Tax=Fortiea sp. LEGE XX443 TaxID=1828611 RepID=UPI00188253BF|nr:hypothetical protein [Fortiea sp. LEGE XX443]MBE9005368.1 hypothetical protein [Fortiea sp. LEGE XX443]
MKEVFALIEQRKQEFAQLPLFEFLQDKSIDPRQRLVFAPCLSPLVMGFAELCTYVFREEPTNNTIQALINQHTYEEQNHWQWLLEDIHKLGLDESLSFTDALRFLWGEETQKTRQVCPQIERYIFKSQPLQRLVAMEVAEAAANVFFSMTAPVITELQPITKKQYRYFGGHHVEMENNHNLTTDDVVPFFEQIQLTDETRQELLELVNIWFTAFTESMDELLAYAQKHKIEQPLKPHKLVCI